MSEGEGYWWLSAGQRTGAAQDQEGHGGGDHLVDLRLSVEQIPDGAGDRDAGATPFEAQIRPGLWFHGAVHSLLLAAVREYGQEEAALARGGLCPLR